MTEWRADSCIYRDSVDLLLLEETASGQAIGKPMLIELEVRNDDRIREPTLSLRPADAQQIINELWRIGYRPKDGSGAVAHTNAIQAHLEDMRSLVFKDKEDD